MTSSAPGRSRIIYKPFPNESLIPVAPFYWSMSREVTAGHMALRNSEHNTAAPTFTHEVIAVDSDGNELYECESLESHEVETALDAYNTHMGTDEVDHYEVRER